jgi:hypothetical protein
MASEILKICKVCLFDGAYLFYAVFVFLVSLAALRTNKYAVAGAAGPAAEVLPPLPGGELPFLQPRTQPRVSVVGDAFSYAVDLASFSFFLLMTRWALDLIRTIFLMRDNPSFIRSFWRYLNVYYLVIVLPAAFMPPVAHPQRAPDFNLLAAVSLLILINALGDVVSVRLILNLFKTFDPEKFLRLPESDPWRRLRAEVTYYLAVLRGGSYCVLILCAVLVVSSILYGIQIGQMDFGFTSDFFLNAWDRILKFPELVTTMYWFRNQPGPFGWTGIPGLFLYGLMTFLPMIILSTFATFWLLLIPFRIAVNLPATTPPVVRVISAEAAVFAMCVGLSYLFADLLQV